jgi:AsmA protein
MKLVGNDMPATDLEGLLPALGVIMPSGASIKSGTTNATLTITGPMDRLVTSGPVSLSNAKLAGFDLGSKMGALSSFAGVAKGADTEIQTLSSDLRIAPDGTRADKISLVVPSIGSIAGSGTIAANHALDFKMMAKVGNSGSALGGLASVASVAGGQSGGGIPFLIHGTTSNPTFEPDMNAMVKGALSGGAKGLTGGTSGAASGAQNLGQTLGGLLGRKKN